MTRRQIAIEILKLFEAVEPDEGTEHSIKVIEKWLTTYTKQKGK